MGGRGGEGARVEIASGRSIPLYSILSYPRAARIRFFASIRFYAIIFHSIPLYSLPLPLPLSALAIMLSYIHARPPSARVTRAKMTSAASCSWPRRPRCSAARSSHPAASAMGSSSPPPWLWAPTASTAGRDSARPKSATGRSRTSGRCWRRTSGPRFSCFADVMQLVAGTRGRQAEQDGDADGGIWSAGQVVGLIDDIPSVADLMEHFMREATETIRGRLGSMLGPSRL